MKLFFLGTCACNYSPRLNGECKDCFDKNARRSSSVLLGENCLIDCGDHCLDSLRIAKTDISKITDIFITHLHSDHFNPAYIEILAKGKQTPVRVWVREDSKLPTIQNTEIRRIKNEQRYAVNEQLYVIGLQANHDPLSYPQHLLFENNDKKFLYACDGAWFLTDTYNYLKNSRLDLCVLDATCGEKEGEYRIAEHNTLPMLRLMLPSLKTVGIIDEHTQIYLSHIAPSLHKPHEEIEKSVEKDGFKVAYDGLELCL